MPLCSDSDQLESQKGWISTVRDAKKAGSTRMASETVPHSPTDRALPRLTSEFERDPVYSWRYGRRRTDSFLECAAMQPVQHARKFAFGHCQARSEPADDANIFALSHRETNPVGCVGAAARLPSTKNAKKAGSTRMASETVPHSPTDRALLRSTSENYFLS